MKYDKGIQGAQRMNPKDLQAPKFSSSTNNGSKLSSEISIRLIGANISTCIYGSQIC